MEASGNNITEEEEADDEDTKSEKGCLNTFSSGLLAPAVLLVTIQGQDCPGS